MGYVADKDTVINFIRGISFYDGFGVGVDFYRVPFTVVYKVLSPNNATFYNNAVAGFTLKEMVNCCGILVSTLTYVQPEFRGRGIAQEFMNLKFAIAKEFGYSRMLATVDIGNNPAEVHILEKFGWKKIDEFVNKRTKHTLGIFSVEVT